MLSKILTYGLVGALAVALIGGTVYILARPAEVVASQSRGQEGIQGQAWGQEPKPEQGATGIAAAPLVGPLTVKSL